MSEVLEGGCHCGGLRYEITGPIKHASYCHCRICQRTMGSPAGIFLSVAARDFRYTAGTPKVYRATASVARQFCGNCGAQIVFHPDGRESLAVNVVTLDEPSRIEPTLHIWTESRIPWFDTTDTHPRWKTNRAPPA
jgi:hypothetical protein